MVYVSVSFKRLVISHTPPPSLPMYPQLFLPYTSTLPFSRHQKKNNHIRLTTYPPGRNPSNNPLHHHQPQTLNLDAPIPRYPRSRHPTPRHNPPDSRHPHHRRRRPSLHVSSRIHVRALLFLSNSSRQPAKYSPKKTVTPQPTTSKATV